MLYFFWQTKKVTKKSADQEAFAKISIPFLAWLSFLLVEPGAKIEKNKSLPEQKTKLS